MEPVGQYAVKLVFDDGHDTGLYSWNYLRELGEQHSRELEEVPGQSTRCPAMNFMEPAEGRSIAERSSRGWARAADNPVKKAGRRKTTGLSKTPARIVGLCSESVPEKPVLSLEHRRPVYTGRPVTDPKKTTDTDFGYERVPWGEKQRRVRGVFDSVAGNYDLMNDLMSGGAHRLWKEFTLSLTGLHAGTAGARCRRRHR